MRRIYLIRHAQPDIPDGRKMCLGSTDIPLGILGRLQSVILAEFMKDKGVTAVFCSDLSRAIQTAEFLSPSPTVIPGLREMDAGAWDGLCFDEIKIRWPEIYAKRGEDPNFPIPGSENTEKGQARFLNAVQLALAQSQGDIAIVAHATVIQSLICRSKGIDPDHCRQFRLGYTSITTMHHFDGIFHPVTIGQMPEAAMTYELCEKLLMAANAPIAHCRDVAAKAESLACEVMAAGVKLDSDLICHGAMLHDIARTRKDHAKTGAGWLQDLGYCDIAEIVECHHNLPSDVIDEKAIVFLADKMPIEDRFAHSLEKCVTNEARAAHQRRYQIALALKEKINTLCGKEIVQ